jgi:hypothetical protein
MAATSLPREIAAGIKYTYTTDSSLDWSSVPASTYFFNIENKLVYFKTSAAQVLPIFSEYNYDYVSVPISSAQILSMGTSPIPLLAAPGVGFYYDIPKVILEYTHISTTYTYPGGSKRLGIGYAQTAVINNDLLTNTNNRVCIIEPTKHQIEGSNTLHDTIELNQALSFSTDNFSNPATGNGTILAKIWYKIRSFG